MDLPKMGGSILGKIGPPFLGWVCVIDSEYHQVEECANRLRQGGAEIRQSLSKTVTHFISEAPITAQQQRREEKAKKYGAIILRPQSIYSDYPTWTPHGGRQPMGASAGRLNEFLFLFPKEVIVLSEDCGISRLQKLLCGRLCFCLLYSDLSTSFGGSHHSHVAAICVLVEKDDGSFGVLIIPFIPSLVTFFFESVLDSQEDRVCFDFKMVTKKLYPSLNPSHAHSLSLEKFPLVGKGPPVKDPLIARWLLSSSEKLPSFEELVLSCGKVDHPPRSLLCSNSSQKGIFVDLFFCLEISALMDQELKSSLLYNPYIEQELPLIPVLCSMELIGVPVDTKLIPQLKKELEEDCVQISQEAKKIPGADGVLLSSPLQVRDALFRSKKSANEEALRAILEAKTAPPELRMSLKDAKLFAEKVLQHRKRFKLLNTYVKPLVTHSKPLAVGEPDYLKVVRPIWLHTGTATGRLSCKEPNLQNLPKIADWCAEIPFRSLLRCPNPECSTIDSSPFLLAQQDRTDFYFVVSDYSQIELRVLADMSEDKDLISSFSNPKVDFFDDLCEKWVDSEKSEKFESTQERRSAIKRLCYGFLYGQGVERMSNQMKRSSKETSRLVNAFKRQYPTVVQYQSKIRSDCYKTGEVRTKFGRRRLLPNIKSPIQALFAEAERQAFNTTIQGSASDLMKRAMVLLHRRLIERGLSSTISLQIHDELVVLAPRKEIEDVAYLVRSCMETASSLLVPTPVVIRIGKSLSDDDLEDYSVWEDRVYGRGGFSSEEEFFG